jgi:hypothetical protein
VLSLHPIRRGRRVGTTLPGVRTLLAAVFVLTAGVARAGRAQAVEPLPGARRVWSGGAQANASVFFGNAEQRVLGGRATIARADSALELRGDLQTIYGDAAVGREPRQVTKRLWLGTATLDYRPLGRTSPFVFATAESNYEKRIAARYSAGVGAKQTFVRTERTETSLSLALLDEQTVPRDSVVTLATTRVARWSWRARARHAFDDRVRVSHVTFWRPRVETAANYLVLSTTDLEYRITRAVSLSLSFIDNYDSEAPRRGARAYNDGQLLFGVAGTW